MKAPASLLWAGIALQASLVSSQALIYTSEAHALPSTGSPPSISPSTARLLLAQRLGLSQYHSLEDADDSALDILNRYGGTQSQIFENDEEPHETEKLLLLIEGASNPEDILDPSVRPALSMQDPPSSSDNEELVMNFVHEDIFSRSAKGPWHFKGLFIPGAPGGFSFSLKGADDSRQQDRVFGSSQKSLGDLLSFYKNEHIAGLDQTTVLHVTTLKGLTPKDGPRYTTALTELKSFIAHFQRPNPRLSSTIIITPASTKKPTKRSTTSPYGTFTKPLFPRQQSQPEEPLTSPSPKNNPPPPASSPETHPQAAAASTTPLPHGIIPTCHSTLSAAISATNNCSSHGTAYQKSGGEPACFACRCEKTIIQLDGGGIKTIYWGGAACQKKDISVPFFLLAGLSILLVGAVTWGVGLIASCGSEELPSVIGAGVAGPRAQK